MQTFDRADWLRLTPELGERWLRAPAQRARHAKRVITTCFHAFSRSTLVLMAACLLIAPATAAANNAAQSVVHMIDYVGVDHAHAVHDGKIKSAGEFKEMVEFTSEVVALLENKRAHPEALEQGKPSPLALALKTLEEAVAAYRSGAKDRARQLAITAYLEGFELAEANLRNADEGLMHEGEREMMALRALITRGASLEEVAAQHARTAAVLIRAQERLSEAGLSPGATFLSSLLILLREGLEAILVLAAIIAFVIRAGRREAMPYIHAGWGSALALGAVTWFVATYIVGQSGASREMTEGVTALLAAAMLIYVGFWLHTKSYAHAWDQFIRNQVGSALAGKTLWAMALVSFLAVYREILEVVLFYQALAAQAGPAGIAPLAGGIVVAALLLGAIGYGIFKLSIRLPLKLFFTAMSALLALLAVVFAGNGIAALQEAGVVPADPVAFVTVPVLGLHPTVETIAAQIITLLVVVACFYFAGRTSRNGTTARSAELT